METTTPDLGPQAAHVARLVAGVRDEQLGDPTPCDGTTVAGMLDHLVGLTTAFTMAARKETVTGTPRASADELIPDWRGGGPPPPGGAAGGGGKPRARGGGARGPRAGRPPGGVG